MAKALVSLDSIASRICSGMDDPGMTYKYKILTHLIAAYKEFHLYVDHEFDVQTAILAPDNIIELPKNFVYETKVGLLRGGKCAVLTLDRNMPPKQLNHTETLEHLENIWNDIDCPGNFIYPFYNSPRGDISGCGCHLNKSGLYNINRKTGTLEIGSLLPSDVEIVIEYKSDGVSAEGLKLVPSEQEDVLSYGAKERFFEDKQNWAAAAKFGEKHKEKWYMTKRLYNFRSALYIAEVAYNSTSEV